MIATGERGWLIGSLLAFAAPVALLGLVTAGLFLHWLEAAVFLVLCAVISAVLGVHLFPLAWWKRVLLAAAYLPTIVVVWVMALAISACIFGGRCVWG